MVTEPKGDKGGKKELISFLCKGANHKQKDCPGREANKTGNFRVSTCFICGGRQNGSVLEGET